MDDVLVTAAFGLCLFVVLWPDRRAAVRLLRRWGVPHPVEDDVTEAQTYLKRRRYWYPPLFFGLPWLADRLPVPTAGNSVSWVVTTLVGGGLLAELLAQRKPKRAHREALLTRRRVVDLVPWWALAALAIAAAGAVAWHVVHRSWTDLGVTVAAVAAVAAVVYLAVRKPVSGTIEVDLALRVRSARVATALGVVVAATEIDLHPSPPSWVIGVLAIVTAWNLVAPLKRVPVPRAGT